MSEYQYYEFAALDRALTEREMGELRALSTRARITSSSFVNEYNWGDLKGDPRVLMEKYFDAFLYFANWGTHRLMLRVPGHSLDAETVALYGAGRRATGKRESPHVILEWSSDDEEGDRDEEWEPRLSTVVGVRDELLRGDRRALYLGWLLAAGRGEIDEDAREPPVPANLGDLSASLSAFADFLRIDPALIEVAAERSPRTDTKESHVALAAWIAAQPDAWKTALLDRVACGEGRFVQAEIHRDFEKHGAPKKTAGARGRTVAELLEAARARAEILARRAAEKAAKERARREQEEAAARARYLDAIEQREAAVWKEVETQLATSRFKEHDLAVRRLVDLRDIAVRRGGSEEFTRRIDDIRQRNAKRSSLLARLDKANLGARGGIEVSSLKQGARRVR